MRLPGLILEKTFQLIHDKKMRSMEGIPGPPPKFPLGTMLDFTEKGKQPWEICKEYGDQYGGMTLIWMGGSPSIVLNDPKLIGDVLIKNFDQYYKDKPVMALRPVNTLNTAFGANGKDWVIKRENEPFCRKGIEHWLPTQIGPMREAVSAHIKTWTQSSEPIDLLPAIRRTMFDAFTVATCGSELGDETYNDFVTMTTVGNKRMKSLLPIPDEPRSGKFKKARQRWFDRFEGLIEEAKKGKSTGRNDLLSVFVGRGFDPPGNVLRDGIMNIPSGGVFSTTSAVLSTLYLLAKNPEAKKVVLEEIQTLKGDFDFEALESCVYLDACLRESMRIYCPVPIFFRNVLKDKSVKLGGYELPPDTEIFINNWRLHRDAEHWKDPERFDPGRWENGGIESNPIGSDFFMPFGRGPRMCLGVPFAMTAMKVTLATILLNAQIDLDPKQEFEQDMFFGVMHPKNLKATFDLKIVNS